MGVPPSAPTVVIFRAGAVEPSSSFSLLASGASVGGDHPRFTLFRPRSAQN